MFQKTKTIFRCRAEILSLVIFLCQNLIIIHKNIHKERKRNTNQEQNLPTTYANKSRQLPVFDKMPWIQLFCTGVKTRSSQSWVGVGEGGGVSELIPPHDAIDNVKCLRQIIASLLYLIRKLLLTIILGHNLQVTSNSTVISLII